MVIQVAEVRGDLLSFEGDALVNPWNRNYVPRWLQNSGGVSGQLKRVTGDEPWKALSRFGVLSLGEAVVTSAGALVNVHSLIHVAGLTARWRATAESVSLSARNALLRAGEHGFARVGMPLIGAGTGGVEAARSRALILEQVELVNRSFTGDLEVILYTWGR